MVRKINNYIYLSMFMSVVMLLLSGFCMFNPDLSFDVVIGLIAAMFIVSGIFMLIFDYRYKSIFINNFFYGVMTIILGVIIWMNSETVRMIFPIGVGIWFIMSALVNIRFLNYFKSESKGYTFLSVLCDIVVILCGAVLIWKPMETSYVLMSTLGITMAFYAISNLVDMLIVKRYVNEIFTNLKKHVVEFIDWK